MYNTNNAYSKYQNQSVNTASKEELTLMLYNGCIKFMGIAEIAIQNDDVDNRDLNVRKAQRIVTELNFTLDRSIDISYNLSLLYDFISERLYDTIVDNNMTALLEAKEIITDMRDTWKEAMKLAKQE